VSAILIFTRLKTKNPRCLNLWHVGFGTRAC
jgi:hypothetical protein